MARKRDYKAEYQRRIAKGRARGLSRAQARGHPKAGESLASQVNLRTELDPRMEEAFKLLRSGMGMVKAAKAIGVPKDRFRRYISANELADWKGRRWIIQDQRMRKVPALSNGRQLELVVSDLGQSASAGSHWHAVGQFVRTNDIQLLMPFRDQGVTDAKGRFYPFETDPNELHRVAALDAPAFHEIYEIIQN